MHVFEAALGKIAKSTLDYARAHESTVSVSLSPICFSRSPLPQTFFADHSRLRRKTYYKSLPQGFQSADSIPSQGLSDSPHLEERLELEAAKLFAERPVIWNFYQQRPTSVHFATVEGALFYYLHHLVS